MNAQKQTTPETPQKPRSMPLKWVCVLLAAAIVITAGVAGMVGRHIGAENAQKNAAREREAYMERYNVGRALLYGRMTESWTKCLNGLSADVVFLGDSITAGGEWADWFTFADSINLGLVGDTTEGLLTRVEQVRVLAPEKCFLLIGINDLIYHRTVQEILATYEEILAALDAVAAETDTRVYVQSVLPVVEGESLGQVRNEQVRELNVGIRALAEAHGLPYLDMYPALANESGMLKQAYSHDGLHLSELGYEAWVNALYPYVEE